MHEKYQIDDLDRQILAILQEDARTPYLDIARKLIVSGGTIHQRVDRLKKTGIIKGSTIEIDYQKLGMDVTVLLGLHLTSSKDLNQVIAQLESYTEVIETYYTTGDYALLIKVRMATIQDFHKFLTSKLQRIESIRATESFVILDTPIKRELPLLEN